MDKKPMLSKHKNQSFDLFLERVLDLSSYVRAKVFAVLVKLADTKTIKFPTQRLPFTVNTGGEEQNEDEEDEDEEGGKKKKKSKE